MTWNTTYTGASSSKTGSTSEILTESRVLKEGQDNLVKRISKLIKKTCLLPGGFPDLKKRECRAGKHSGLSYPQRERKQKRLDHLNTQY